MKLPKKTKAAFKRRHKAPPGPGGGAAARAYQFGLERGVVTDPTPSSAKKATKTLRKKAGAAKS